MFNPHYLNSLFIYFTGQSAPVITMPDYFDVLDLPDNLLVEYAESLEHSCTAMKNIRSNNLCNPNPMPSTLNMSNCSVAFNYYGPEPNRK